MMEEVKISPAELIHKPRQLSSMEQGVYPCLSGEGHPAPITDDISKSCHRAGEQIWNKKNEYEVRKENKRNLKKQVKKRS